MMTTYLNDTSNMMVQNITDRTPRILAATTGSGWGPVKVACIAYSGLVPISPYTTPIAPSTSGDNFCFVCVPLMSQPFTVEECGGTLRLRRAECNHRKLTCRIIHGYDLRSPDISRSHACRTRNKMRNFEHWDYLWGPSCMPHKFSLRASCVYRRTARLWHYACSR